MTLDNGDFRALIAMNPEAACEAHRQAMAEVERLRVELAHAGVVEQRLRDALKRAPTKHGWAHPDGSACKEPAWCQREHMRTPEARS